MRWLCLSLLLATACTTYPDGCNRRAMAELRTVDRLINETQANLARGYAYEYVDTGLRTGLVFCSGGHPTRICTSTDTRPTRRPVAIDPEAERRKLASLSERREALVAATASCRPV